MNKFIFIFFWLVIFSCALQVSYAGNVILMDKFSWSDWENAGAEIFYNDTTGEIKIQKDSFRFEPRWGSIKIELGTINIDGPQENNLAFEVVDLNGSYSLTLHYGGKELYDSNYIKVQEPTNMTGLRKYDFSQALRNNGLKGQQQIQLEISVWDDDDDEEPGGGMLLIKNLTFTYDD